MLHLAATNAGSAPSSSSPVGGILALVFVAGVLFIIFGGRAKRGTATPRDGYGWFAFLVAVAAIAAVWNGNSPPKPAAVARPHPVPTKTQIVVHTVVQHTSWWPMSGWETMFSCFGVCVALVGCVYWFRRFAHN
jgi:hypothetical protein